MGPPPVEIVGLHAAEDALRVYGQSIDMAVMLDTTAEEHQRFGACCRVVLRRHKGIVTAATIHEALDLTELGGATGQIGPATGHRTSERGDHVTRCLQYWAQGYDPKAGSGGGRPLFGVGEERDVNLKWLEARVRSRFSQATIDEQEVRFCHSRAITYQLLTTGAAYLLHGMHTSRPGEVPHKFIRKCLAKDGFIHKDDHHTISCILAILTHSIHGWFRIVRAATTNQCRAYEMRAECPVPAWLKVHGEKILKENKETETPAPHVPSASGFIQTPITPPRKTMGGMMTLTNENMTDAVEKFAPYQVEDNEFGRSFSNS